MPVTLLDVGRIADGRTSFVHSPGLWRPTLYEGAYRNGLRDGLWRASDAESHEPLWEITWSAGEWHGPARSWHLSGQLEHEGVYAHGERAGRWTYWFQNGRIAAEGHYAHDRKIGEWQYWDVRGNPMTYVDWEREHHDYDWAYDDYAGMPRGENWPEPPAGKPPS